MLLIHGTTYPSDVLEEKLDDIKRSILQTRNKPLLNVEAVYRACNAIADKMILGEYDDLLTPYFTKKQIEMAGLRLTKESLERKVKEELSA